MTDSMTRRRGALLLALAAIVALAVGLLPPDARAATTGTISGTVYEQSGTGVTGGTIDVYNAANDTLAATEAIQAGGAYSAITVNSGNYIVEALPASGSSDIPTYYNNTKAGAATPYTAKVVTVGTTASTVNIYMAIGGTIEGQITNPAGTGIPDVTVELCYDSAASCPGTATTVATTTANGDYTLSQVPAGSYWLFINAANENSSAQTNYVEQWYGAPGGGVSGFTQSNAKAVSVTADQTTQGVNQALAVGGEITGKITDTSAAPLQGSVTAVDAEGTLLGSANSSTSGAYTIYGLPSTNVSLYAYGPFDNASGTAVADANGWYGASGPAVSLQTGSPIPVTANNSSATANFAMPAAATITGTVLGNGQPVSGVEPMLFDTQGNPIEGEEVSETGALFYVGPADQFGDTPVSQADGTYQVSGLLPGSYKVEFSTADGTNSENSANLGFQFYDNQTSLAAANLVTLTAGQSLPGINAALTTGAQITGTVTSAATGVGVASVEVELQDANGDVLDTAYTLADGTYTLSGIPTGTYNVEFVAPTGQSVAYQNQYYGGKQVLAGSTAVSVTAGQTTPGINAALVSGTTSLQIPTVTPATPVVSGTARVGDTLKAVNTGWTAGTLFSYQWYAGSTAIRGATAATLKLTAADYRKAITVHVLGAQSGYVWANAVSAATKPVAAGLLKTVAPKITGTFRVRGVLRVKTGIWTAGTKFTYQWYANAKKISGARKATLKLTAKDLRKRISVKVTGVLKGYVTVARLSHRTVRILAVK